MGEGMNRGKGVEVGETGKTRGKGERVTGRAGVTTGAQAESPARTAEKSTRAA
jgi:hypothetical protein